MLLCGKSSAHCICVNLIQYSPHGEINLKGRDHKDSYSEAIPIDHLVKMAEADIHACSVQNEEVIRHCASKVVREEL